MQEANASRPFGKNDIYLTVENVKRKRSTRIKHSGCWHDCPAKEECSGERQGLCRSTVYQHEMPSPNELVGAVDELMYERNGKLFSICNENTGMFEKPGSITSYKLWDGYLFHDMVFDDKIVIKYVSQLSRQRILENSLLGKLDTRLKTFFEYIYFPEHWKLYDRTKMSSMQWEWHNEQFEMPSVQKHEAVATARFDMYARTISLWLVSTVFMFPEHWVKMFAKIESSDPLPQQNKGKMKFLPRKKPQ